MRQLVYTMFVSNSRASFHLWCKENLLKHQKVPKYYESNCSKEEWIGKYLQSFLSSTRVKLVFWTSFKLFSRIVCLSVCLLCIHYVTLFPYICFLRKTMICFEILQRPLQCGALMVDIYKFVFVPVTFHRESILGDFFAHFTCHYFFTFLYFLRNIQVLHINFSADVFGRVT